MLDYDFHISTPRLCLSHINPQNPTHCAFISALKSLPVSENEIRGNGMSNKPVVQGLHEPGPSLKVIMYNAERMERTGYGRYLVSLKPSAQQTSIEEGATPFSQLQLEHVGVVSMQLARHPVAPLVPDIGFRLHADYLGKGYATEAAVGLMKYYEEERGWKKMAGFCDPTNEASKKCLKRSGLEERGIKMVPGIHGDGSPTRAMIWTKGVGWEEGELERDLGI